MKTSIGVLLAAALSMGNASAAPVPHDALARDLLWELVGIDTTPANGCTKAAEAMAARLRAGGFDSSDVVLAGARPEKQNLVVRLRGRGTAKPVLFVAHLDVVPAPREGWNSDPFQLTERDGFFYGRGVQDVKYAAAQLVANLIRLRAERYAPDRDILIAPTADEESGNANGAAWLTAQRPDLMDVAYCINMDAGGGLMEKGKRTQMSVQTSEKVYTSFRIAASSQGGHSSQPTDDTHCSAERRGACGAELHRAAGAGTRAIGPTEDGVLRDAVRVASIKGPSQRPRIDAFSGSLSFNSPGFAGGWFT